MLFLWAARLNSTVMSIPQKIPVELSKVTLLIYFMVPNPQAKAMELNIMMFTYKDRRDPDYEPPKYSGEELEDMFCEKLEEKNKERKIESTIDREIKSIEDIW